MNIYKLAIVSIIIVIVIIFSVVLISFRSGKTEEQNGNTLSLIQNDNHGQLRENYSRNNYEEKSKPSEKKGEIPEEKSEPSEKKKPIEEDEPLADQPSEKPPTLISSKALIKKIRTTMIENVKTNESLSEEQLEVISTFDDDTDLDSIISDELKFIKGLLRAFAEKKIVTREFVKDFMEEIVSKITLQISSGNLKTAEITEDIPMMIDYIKSFLIYEYIVLTNDLGNPSIIENSTNNLISILTSNASTFDEHYLDNYMYYQAALLLSQYLFDFRNYKMTVQDVSTWEQKYRESFAKCKGENSDAFKFYSSTFELLKTKVGN